MLHVGIGRHGDRSTKLFGGQEPCYGGQWPLTGRYFKRCIWHPLLGGRNWSKNEMLSDVGAGEVSKCSGRPIFIFFIKENLICSMTRHNVVSNINILLTRNIPIDFGVRHWSHSLMTPLHCLCAKSNNRKRGQFECDITWFCFCFDFVRLHGRCGCCSIVCLKGWGLGEWGVFVQN